MEALEVCLSACRCVYMSVCTSIGLSLYLCLYVIVSVSMSVSVYPCVSALFRSCVVSPPGRRVHSLGSTGASPCPPGGPHTEPAGAPRWMDASFPVSEPAAGTDAPVEVQETGSVNIESVVQNHNGLKIPYFKKDGKIWEHGIHEKTNHPTLLTSLLFFCQFICVFKKKSNMTFYLHLLHCFNSCVNKYRMSKKRSQEAAIKTIKSIILINIEA